MPACSARGCWHVTSWSACCEHRHFGAGARVVSVATTEPALVIIRHGDTEWSENGRHTGRTDLPLLPEGREHAKRLRAMLAGRAFGCVLSSPLRRARETCELAGLGAQMQICDELREWDYGDYEGLTSVEIHARNPDWSLWRDGCPGGESPAQVSARADHALRLALATAAASDGAEPACQHRTEPGEAPLPTIAFAHGHILRVLTARWIGMQAGAGERFALAAAGIGRLGHEHTTRVIEGWNIQTL